MYMAKWGSYRATVTLLGTRFATCHAKYSHGCSVWTRNKQYLSLSCAFLEHCMAIVLLTYSQFCSWYPELNTSKIWLLIISKSAMSIAQLVGHTNCLHAYSGWRTHIYFLPCTSWNINTKKYALVVALQSLRWVAFNSIRVQYWTLQLLK